MATAPPPEAPPAPEQAPSELPPLSPDTDVPSPATTPPPSDKRSDIQQAVEARRDAVTRGEGGPEPEMFTSPGLSNGEGGAAGVVRNQDDDAQ